MKRAVGADITVFSETKGHDDEVWHDKKKERKQNSITATYNLEGTPIMLSLVLLSLEAC
jgi:hypothetical protein